MRSFRLSKSRITAGLQCSKRLWLTVHRPELLAYDRAAQQRFCAGDEVGCLARELYGPGVLIGGANLSAAVRETSAALAARGDVTLFEATFRHRDVLVRGDILRRRGGVTELIEVKSATRLKEQHLQDIAVQAWVIEGAGVTLDALKVAVVNPQFVYPGGGDYRGLLREMPVSSEARQIMARVPAWVREYSRMLAGPCPSRPAGVHCNAPYDCPFKAACAERAGGDARAPACEPSQCAAVPSWEGGPGGAAVSRLLAALSYPRRYLEFRTAQYAVPPWPGTKPYQHLVVRWSCDVEDAAGRLRRRVFPDAEGDGQQRAVTEELLDVLGEYGPIFVSTEFERLCLREMVEALPDLGASLERASARLVVVADLVCDVSRRPAAAETTALRPVARSIASESGDSEPREVNDNAGGSEQAAYHDAGVVNASPVRHMHAPRSLQEWSSQNGPALCALVHRLADGPVGTPRSG